MSKLNSLYVSLLALVVAFVALGMSIHYGAQKKDVNVEETLNNNPEIIINAMQSYEQKLREQAAAEAQKLIEANLPALNNDANTPFIGAADAPVVLVEFFDFSCHYCHKVYPAIKQIAEANPDIKIVFKPLTFVAPISKYAAKAALAANEQGKFFDVYNAIFSFEGRPDEAKIDELDSQIINYRNTALMEVLLERQNPLIYPQNFFNANKLLISLSFDMIKSPLVWYNELDAEAKSSVKSTFL